MLKLLLLSFVFIASLLANKVIYLSYEEIPQRVVKGEIFQTTLKVLSTVRDFQDITYKFHNALGIKVLSPIPYRETKGKYLLETFYFQAKSSNVRLPDIEASLVTLDNVANYDTNQTQILPTTTLKGQKLNVITLNPKKDFSNIIANNLVLQEFKTTRYDTKHNIIVFVAIAQNTDITQLHFQNVYKQGIESSNDSIFDAKITYYIVIDKRIENFSFSYFNLKKNSFQKLNIPIIVDDDSVVAQSDLKPKSQSKKQLKINIAGGIAFVGFLFVVWRKKYIYLLFILVPLAYIIYLSIPEQDVCIKTGSDIHLLPVENGTIFETTKTQQSFQKEGSVQGFIKVKLKNNKIGWVKHEDICSY